MSKSLRVVAVFFFGLLSVYGQGLGAKQNVDLIVAADHLVTMDEDRLLIENGALAIDKGQIIAIDDAGKIHQSFNSKEIIEGKNRIVMPGLINGHTHSAMVLFRGLADDLALMEWLTKYIFPAEIRFVNEDFIRIGTRLACLEMIKGGTTTFVDMYFHPKEIARVVDECGMRAVIAAAVIEQESGYAKGFDDAMTKAESYINEWKNRNNRITPAIAAHSAYTISAKSLVKVRQRARALGVPVAIHLSESEAELEIVKKQYQDTSINHLEKIDFFSGPTIGAHVVWPMKEEIPILVKRKIGAIHNPTSNMKISSGFAPVPEMLDAGVAVGLGTDGAASNNDLDMWEEIRLAALLHKGRLVDPKVMPARRVLEIATSTGARAVGLQQEVGMLKVGKRADLIQIATDAPHLTPLYDVISHLVYAVDAQDVRTVIIDGKVVMKERVVLSLDEAAVLEDAREIAARINKEMRQGK